MTIDEFKEGIDDRQARVVSAASDCVRHLRQDMKRAIVGGDRDRLLTAMTQTRFFPYDQRELIEAVMDLHDFSTGSGKYQLTDAERLVKLELLAQEADPAPWVLEELTRLRQE